MECLAILSAVVAVAGIVGMYLDRGENGYRVSLLLLAIGLIAFVISAGAMFAPQN